MIEKRNKKRKEGAISASDAPKGQKPSAQGTPWVFMLAWEFSRCKCKSLGLRLPLHLHVNPDAPPSLTGGVGGGSFPFDDGLVDVWILFQNVKDHFCIVEVVAMDVGSLALQVSGIQYAPDSGVQTLRAIPAIDVDGSPDSVS